MGGNVDILTHCTPLTLNFFRNVVFFSTANLKISALLIQFNIDTWRTKMLLFQFSVQLLSLFFIFVYFFSIQSCLQILCITKKRTYSHFWCLQMKFSQRSPNILKYKAKNIKINFKLNSDMILTHAINKSVIFPTHTNRLSINNLFESPLWSIIFSSNISFIRGDRGQYGTFNSKLSVYNHVILAVYQFHKQSI